MCVNKCVCGVLLCHISPNKTEYRAGVSVCVRERQTKSDRKSYTGRAKAVSHDEVECSTGLVPVAVHTAAAVLKHFLAQICTLLCLLLEQHVPKLQTITPAHHFNDNNQHC